MASPPEGLSEAEAVRRLAAAGENRLPQQGRRSLAAIVLGQFLSPLIYLLLAAAVLSLAIGEAGDALFIAAVLVINASIGAVQEARSQKSAEKLARYVEMQVRVRRDGRLLALPAHLLVPGDRVLMESGDAVSADLRLLETRGLRIEEAALTGESMPVLKDAGAALLPAQPLAERSTMAYAGTAVLAGRAEGLVVATGAATELGRIAGSLSGQADAPPPLVRRLEVLTRRLSLFAIVGVLFFVLVGWLADEPLELVIVTAVALAVSAIPEGLPVAVTVALSVARHRMAKRHVIVRSLPAVEGLGACTLIASDKTGTLTQNRLAVGALAAADGRRLAADHPATRTLIECALLASEGSIGGGAAGTAQRIGDSVDLAFHDLAAAQGLQTADLRRGRRWRMLVPYEPHLRLSAALAADAEGVFLAVKGAPETLLALASAVPAALHETVAALTAEGYRVLAVARRRLADWPTDEAEPLSLLAGLELLGCAGLSDPLRAEAAAAVAACAAGGIQVDMVTGDHPATALAIARQLGIAQDPGQVVTGQAVAEAGANLPALLAKARVFARVEPLQKLAIVQARLAQGHFVAVTGDGVNDAPALKAASIGVAMGKSGTDVAREAADLILTDDNFASIVAGVEEGRIAYANVRKVILLLLATGLAEVMVFLAALVAALPLPLFATQLLWLNLVTNGSQDVALGLEPGEPGIGRERPRAPKEPLVDRRLFRLIVILGGGMGVLAALYYGLLLGRGHPEGEARAALLLLLVAMENVAVLSCRSELRSLFRTPFFGNPWLLGSVVLALGLQVVAFHIPVLREALRLEVPSWAALAWLPFFLLAYLGLAEGAKAVLRRRVGPAKRAGL